MKKLIIISIFILGMILPNINVKAVDVSNEEELKAAIEQGGDITLTQNIEVTQPLVIDKDVNISGYRDILMQGNNTLITVNDGTVNISAYLYAGWNGEYDKYDDPVLAKNQGTAMVVNEGTVNFDDSSLNAGNVGLEVNGGTVTGSPMIYAGEYNENTYTYSGGNALIVNGGAVDFDFIYNNLQSLNHFFMSSGDATIVVNDKAVVNINGVVNYDGSSFAGAIISYEGNGIEANDGGTINLTDELIVGTKNSIYLDGGTVNLNGIIAFESDSKGYSIYINKGINTIRQGDILSLNNDLLFGANHSIGYLSYKIFDFSIYINPDITELRVTDKNNFLSLNGSKLKLNFCSNNASASNTDTEDGPEICNNLSSFAYYDGPVYSNELNSCTLIYINGEKSVVDEENCNVQTDNTEENNNPQVVEVPSTSAYASIIIIVLGIICVVVSVIVTRKMTRKENY